MPPSEWAKAAGGTNYDFDEVHNRPLSPSALNKQTYYEIFKSQKNSLKRPLNFINYSNTNYDVVNNVKVEAEETRQGFLEKRIKYGDERPKYKDNELNHSSTVRMANGH